MPFFGVTVIVAEQVPVLSDLIRDPLSLQSFVEDVATMIFTFDDEAIVIFAFFARQAREMLLPFLTEHSVCRTFKF